MAQPGTQLENSVQTILDWTPQGVRSAIAAADSGQLQPAADLVEAMMIDDRISGVTATVTLTLLGLPVMFDGAEEPVAALQGTDGRPGDFWKMFPESELAKLAAWGRLLGVGLGRLENRIVGDRVLPTLRTWHPRWLRYQHSTDEWFVTTLDGEELVTPGDGWIMYTPFGQSRPWASGAWRALYKPYLVKQYGISDWQRHNQTHGQPIMVGSAPQGARQLARDRFADDLRNMGRKAAIVLPDGYDLKLVEAMGKGFETFGSAIAWADAAIEVELVGQVVTTEGSSGFSDGKVEERLRHEILAFLAETLSTCVHDQGLTSWAELNYGTEEVAPWAYWNTKRKEDLAARAAMLQAMGDAISKLNGALSISGVRVDVDPLLQSMGLSTVELPRTDTEAPSIALAPTDLASIILVNEGRAAAGLGPLKTPTGADDPNGKISIDEFRRLLEPSNDAEPALDAGPLAELDAVLP